MRIKKSKNLKYTLLPYHCFEPIEKAEPEKCILEAFHALDSKLELLFKNGTQAFIEAKTQEGGMEIDRVEKKLEKFIGRSYEDILKAKF